MNKTFKVLCRRGGLIIDTIGICVSIGIIFSLSKPTPTPIPRPLPIVPLKPLWEYGSELGQILPRDYRPLPKNFGILPIYSAYDSCPLCRVEPFFLWKDPNGIRGLPHSFYPIVVKDIYHQKFKTWPTWPEVWSRSWYSLNCTYKHTEAEARFEEFVSKPQYPDGRWWITTNIYDEVGRLVEP